MPAPLHNARKFKRPPCVQSCLDGTACRHDRHDSVVWTNPGDPNFREFVVYEKNKHCYLEYLIEYERR
jgi:hypothetical protein